MLKRTYLWIAFVLFGISLFLGVDRHYHRCSSRFSFNKIHKSNLFSREWGTPHLSDEEMNSLKEILNQKFLLYDRGAHSYIYVSEDGRYILKILKHQHLIPKSWLAYFPFSFNPYYQELLFNKNKCHAILESWKAAFSDLKEETGLIYLHANQDQKLNQKVTILDGKVREHRIDLDKVVFCVQRYASLIYLKIAELMHEKNVEGAKAIISTMFQLMDRLAKKGVIDENFCSAFNIGLIGEEAIQIHISELRVNTIQNTHSLYRQRIDLMLNPVQKWIDRSYPELSAHFAACLEELKRAD